MKRSHALLVGLIFATPMVTQFSHPQPPPVLLTLPRHIGTGSD